VLFQSKPEVRDPSLVSLVLTHSLSADSAVRAFP
jgi:hypothetical protein